MAKFTDTAGREWVVEFTVGAIKRARAELGVDLTKLTEDKFTGYLEAAGDPVRLSEVLYAMCRGQHPAVSLDQFQEGLGGDTLFAAAEAFQGAFLSFCPSHQREAIQTLVATHRETETTILKAITEQAIAASLTTATASPLLSE